LQCVGGGGVHKGAQTNEERQNDEGTSHGHR
jgi:hypothetical protein